MIYDAQSASQATLFVDATEMVPSPENIQKYLRLFQKFEMVPKIFQEVTSSGARQRLALHSPKNEWSIQFGSDRIVVNKNHIPDSRESKNLPDDFSEAVFEIMSTLRRSLNKKANRISRVAGGVLYNIPSENLDNLYSKLFVPLSFYSKNMPFEWSSRAVAHKRVKINGKFETINVITNIGRVEGVIDQPANYREFEGIEISFDINTIPQNKDLRFEPKHLKEFIKKAEKFEQEICSDIEALIKE